VTRPDTRAQARAVERQLRQIQRALRRPVDSEIARGRLTAPQRSVMRALAHAKAGLALKDLAADVGLSHSTVSGIVDRLEQRGWVVRRTDDEDARRTRITVSQTVHRYIRKTLPELTLSPLVHALAALSNAERDALLASLTRLSEALGPPQP
jgi:DNA-binding MarR family transcriptional regulator